jgi:hypothetical protein
MSMSKELREQLALEEECPACAAKAGKQCRHVTSYKRNSELKHPHKERVQLADRRR